MDGETSAYLTSVLLLSYPKFGIAEPAPQRSPAKETTKKSNRDDKRDDVRPPIRFVRLDLLMNVNIPDT